MDYKNIKPDCMEIKVLGADCKKCKTLEKITRQAVEELGLTANITKVEDIVEIMQAGIMNIPALVINGKVVLKGTVPSFSDIKQLLTKY